VESVSDILIRDVPEPVVAEIDRRAAAQGLSRAEYLRRRLDVEYRAQPTTAVTAADWRRFHDATVDLDNPDVMDATWS
jgi:hypothetical protein